MKKVMAAVVVALTVLTIITAQQVQASGVADAPPWPTAMPPSDATPIPTLPMPTPSHRATPQPVPTESNDGDEETVVDNVINKIKGATQVVFDPSASLKELASGMLKDTFKDIDGALEDLLNTVLKWAWKLALGTSDGGMYATAAKPFTAIGIALFVPMALLRLVWYHKRALIGEDDALTAVAFDIVTAAVMVLGIGHFVDWTAEKTFTLTAVALEKVGIHGLVPQHLGLREMGAAMSNSIGTLLMFGFLLLGGLLAISAFGMAFVAIHGVFYILVALGPIVFTIGMLSPLGWLKRVWWMAFGAVIIAPFVGAAALGALMLVISTNFGGDVLLMKYMIRMVWLWAAAGMMWTLLGLLTRFTLATSVQMAGKLVSGAISAVAGLTAAGALASAGGFSLGSLNGLGAGGGGAGGGSGGSALPSAPTPTPGSGGSDAGGVGGGNAGGGGRGGLNASSPQEHLDQAANHSLRAGALSALSRVPGLGGLSAAAGYHRTLADVHRLRGMHASGGRSTPGGGGENAPVAPHSAALNVFSQIEGGGESEYRSALQGVQGKLGGIEDPELGPVMPAMWSESNDPNLSRLSAGLAALYRREPQLFDGMDANRWFEIKGRAQQIIGGDTQ